MNHLDARKNLLQAMQSIVTPLTDSCVEILADWSNKRNNLFTRGKCSPETAS